MGSTGWGNPCSSNVARASENCPADCTEDALGHEKPGSITDELIPFLPDSLQGTEKQWLKRATQKSLEGKGQNFNLDGQAEYYCSNPAHHFSHIARLLREEVKAKTLTARSSVNL